MRIENILEEYKSSRVSSDCTKKNCKWQTNLFVLEGSVMPLWHNRMNSTLKCSVIKSQEQITIVTKNGLLSSVLYGTRDQGEKTEIFGQQYPRGMFSVSLLHGI